jgi:hypothetical protein
VGTSIGYSGLEFLLLKLKIETTTLKYILKSILSSKINWIVFGVIYIACLLMFKHTLIDAVYLAVVDFFCVFVIKFIREAWNLRSKKDMVNDPLKEKELEEIKKWVLLGRLFKPIALILTSLGTIIMIGFTCYELFVLYKHSIGNYIQLFLLILLHILITKEGRREIKKRGY